MSYNLEIQKLRLQIDNIDSLDDKIKLLKQAINTADANNDLDWGYDLRIDLMHYDGYRNNAHESFVAFTWILNACDTHSDLFDEKDILDRYSWMVHKSFDQLSISRAQVENIMSDFEQRLVRNGLTRRDYYDARAGWALFRGDVVDARRNLLLRNNEAADSVLSSLDLITQMCVELLEGNMDKGIVTASEIISKFPDEEGPMYSMLIYYLTKVKDSRAGEYFEKVDKLLMSVFKAPFMLFDISQIMYYLARNNEEKAWVYFEKYAVWEVDANDYLSFDFALAILPMFRSGGVRTLNLSSRMPYYRSDNKYDLAELYAYYYARVSDLADRFDARNENNYFREQMNFML